MKVRPPPTTGITPEVAQWMREVMQQVNLLSEGKLSAKYSASAAAPTTGIWATGDFIANSSPSELGIVGGKYIITGWEYVGGTWLQCRTLTGN